MRLKSLKLAGFKSFANPTTFHFKHDITAIVGPNGCGKSNVIDAIRWVLGESSAKQLRGGAMSDVIFAGVEGRAAKSLASVELVFEHTQDEAHGIRHELNLYQELSLRRQVTKDGKSDYFINGQRVRRRDVVDVFLGTGLGARSYAVIEQGMIGRIVDSSPMQLREFIEEAAGVSRYQVRRADTEKKLTETRENLDRLSDLQGELKKQQKTLAKQAQSAKVYQALNDELTQLKKEDLLRRIFEAWQYHELKKGEQGQKSEILASLEAKVTKARQDLDVLSAKAAEGQWLKDEARNNYHNAQMAEQTAQHNFYTINSQINQNEEKITRLSQQQAEALNSIQHSQEELAQIQKELTVVTPQVTALSDQLDTAKESLAQAQDIWQKRRDELTDLDLQKNQLQNQQKLAQSQIERLQLNQLKWQKKQEQLQLSMQALQEQGDDGQIKIYRQQADDLKLRLEALEDDGSKQEFDELGRLVQEKQLACGSLEKRHAVLQGEYDTLHKLVHTPVQPSEDQTDQDLGLQSLAVLQDAIELTDLGKQHTQVLDVFLGFWLDARLTDKLPMMATTSTSPKVSAVLSCGHKTIGFDLSVLPDGLTDRFVPLDRLIKAPKLTFLQVCYLYLGDVADLGELMDIQEGFVAGLILTQTGWLIGSFGMMHLSRLGSQNNQFLSQRQLHLQRLDQLEEALNALEIELQDQQDALKSAQIRLDKLRVSIEERAAQRVGLTKQLHETEQALTKLLAQAQAQKLQLENLQKNQLALDEERAESDKEIALLNQEMLTAGEQLSGFAPKWALAQQAMQTANQQIEEKNQTLKTYQDQHQAVQLKQTTLLQGQIHTQRLLQMAQDSASYTQTEIETTKNKQQALQDELPKLEEVFKQAKLSTHELKIISDEHEAAMRLLQLEQTKLQEALTLAHTEFASAQAQAAQLAADTAVGESRLQDLAAEMLGMDKDFNLASTLVDFRHKPDLQFVDNVAQREAVKEKILKLGAVNLAAAQELEELEGRVSPMDAQIADITASMVKLQDAIRAIDDKTKSLFLNTLSVVNKELNALFSKVFGGGQASLSLMDDDGLTKADKWRAGLVLMAQPKGKKNSRLAVLSGGEKTLTALSLIFAIFKQHPAPFCVLDEVDAPLDDANVARFTGLIHELADSVQFIFISHNKLAMQIADELKGITMPTAGISSLVTVDLQQAEKYLESGL